MGSDVPPGTAASSRVELRLAGTFGVIRDGTELSEGELGSRKSRTLLKLLAVERPGLVLLDRIVEVLWAADPPTAAGQNVAALVSRLRRVLGPGVILGSRQAYRLADAPAVIVDLDAAARYCGQAERKLTAYPAIALAAAEQAIGLLAAGVALADEPYATWVDPARGQLRNLARRARLAAAEAALAIGDARVAIRHAEAATAADPLDEAAHHWYMSACASAGEPAKALVAYAALRDRLAEELGADPAPETQQMHLALLRQHPSQLPRLSHSSRPTWPTGPTLVGREAETGALREAWGRAVAADPGLVMIIGEAGIGKTALAEDLAAQAAETGATVLRTRCYEAERSLFLQPIVEALAPVVARLTASALRQLLGEHGPAAAALLPEVAALLGPAPSWRGSPEMERRRSFGALTAFLSGLAERNPVLLVVDDLQYAGQSTSEFLHYLGRQISGSRLLAVTTVRAEYDHEIGSALAPVATRVEVGPLGPAAVAQLAREAGQTALTDSILRRTRGHTFFVVEVLRALAGGDVGIPESLRSAVQARVRQAGPATETLLRAASVLGAAIDPLTLGELLQLTPAAAVERCEQALAARLLVISGRDYEFANDLIREVMYASTPEPTRLAYHRRAADLLTRQPESLARHAAAADDWPRAARAWLLAAEEAMRRHAATDAITLSTQALEAAEHAGDAEVRARALVVRGSIREAAGDYAAALSDLTLGVAGARAVGDRRLEMRALCELGRSRPWTVPVAVPRRGDVSVSRTLPTTYYTSNLTGGLRIAESLGDRATEADLLARLAVNAANRLHLDAALDFGLRAVAAGRASANEHALAAGLDSLKAAYLHLGDARGLADVLAELDPLLRRLGDLFLLQWAEFESSYLSIAAGDWDQAAAAMRAGLETNRRGGYPQFAAWYTAHLGWLARIQGHDDEALTLGRQALTIAMTEEHENTWWKAAACAMLGTTLLQHGDRAEAIGLFERGLATAEEAGMEGYRLRCAAPLTAATGSPAVLAEADRLLAQASIPAGGAWLLGDEAYLFLAKAWLARSDPERARLILAPLLAVAERVPWTATLAATLAVDGQALIRLGDGDQARAELRRAEGLAREHGLPHVLREARSAQRRLRAPPHGVRSGPDGVR
ncbi:MAG TPA: AAA family ATPase [Streptosporangiaceae bacterium]|nr:AAA family ATPase [Streptosporangiaceae bacterium]